MSELPLVLTVEETASALRLGRTACYEAIRRGEIPSVRIGRSLRVPRGALEQLLNVNGQGPAADGVELRLLNQKQRGAARSARKSVFARSMIAAPARGIVDQPALAPERMASAFLSGGDPVAEQVAPAGLPDQLQRDRAPSGDQPRQRLLLGWAALRPDRDRCQHGCAVRARQCRIASSDDPQQR